MGCCNKFSLFVVNFLVFGIGVAVVVLASLVISKDEAYGSLLQQGVFSLPIIILIAGLLILIIGFLGCCGALKENSCMLKTYAGIVLLFLVAEIILGILILVYTNQAETIIKQGMTEIYEQYDNGDKALKESLDHAQHDLKCCGVNNYTDWSSLPYGEKTGNVADGCCQVMSEGCGVGVLNQPQSVIEDTIYTEGCYMAIKDDIQGVAIGLGVVCIALALLQLLSISCACGIANKSSHYA
ncbi:tetraspanin-3-like [Palaemon carinicauda]|uniref:tetraspanin-3-like n=1 Tax=Palaemon carinicauda TaxID=392227 RepID=UPI0035B63E6A